MSNQLHKRFSNEQVKTILAKYTHKEIKAKVMSLGEYNLYRGWGIPANEDPAAPGYLVEYKSGYQSWSPKKELDEGYAEI